ncbi:MAG: methyltransferase, partial [Magnetococcales bacterium]|nr:methyltransferase [Magnetococcales bacterium]
FAECETALCKGHLRLHTLPAASRPLPEKNKEAPFRPAADGFAYWSYESLKVAVKPGIFSWRAIDPATQLLLETVQDSPGARVLDWGCGSGVIGATLAHRFPAIHVTLSDDLLTATRCARRTVELNGLDARCEVITEDGIGPQLVNKRFDTIFTNPPFHRGVRTDHDATLAFLAAATQRLVTGGSLWLVGNRFMDYGTLLKEQLGAVEEIDGDDAFTVWRGVKSAARADAKPGRKSTHARTAATPPDNNRSRDRFRDLPNGRWIGAD